MTRLQRLQRQYRRDVHRARLLYGDDAADDMRSEYACDPPDEDDAQAVIGDRYSGGQSRR